MPARNRHVSVTKIGQFQTAWTVMIWLACLFMSPQTLFRRFGPALVAVLLGFPISAYAQGTQTPPVPVKTGSAETDLGLQVAEGFTITRFAGDELAHDIYSMTLDSQGRVVVSGNGYVKILIDENRDGVADRAETFVDNLPGGAQGMAFYGRDLICADGEGLVRYADRDGNDRADGPPDVFLKIKTGKEHDLHAVRKGPDGWWYLIAGNTSEITPQYAALPTSPVKKPHAGAVLRMKPDLSAGEIYAHGFRNAYDFDFSQAGEVFAYDSDGENVMSLPWYQPTKLFHVLPGSHQGWISNNWIRPDHAFDAPPVVAAFGRGSPTGVVCYRHTSFPESYHGALFLQDWTFGRVYVVRLNRQGSTWKGKPEVFISAVGQHGFAPTDIEIGPEGEMYVCVGGRGTQGGVYCIRAVEKNPGSEPWPGGNGIPATSTGKLDLCLKAPQPLSSWSRRVWEPVATSLGSGPFVAAARDQSRPVQERIRAIEILTDKLNGIGGDLAATLARDPDPIIRARAAWSLGRTHSQNPNPKMLAAFYQDEDPFVVRAAVEATFGADEQLMPQFIESLGAQLSNRDRLVRQAASRLLGRATLETVHKMAEVAFPKSWAAAIPVAASTAGRVEGYSSYTVDIGMRLLKGRESDELKLEGVRILQLGLGDLRPADDSIADVFHGYAPSQSLSARAADVQLIGQELAKVYPTSVALLDHEIERVFAMLASSEPQVLAKILSQITADSPPVDDIHRLIVLARLTSQRTPEQTQAIAQAILQLEDKFEKHQLQQDSAWDDRIMEMVHTLVEQDPALPLVMMKHPLFGNSAHIQFVPLFPEEELVYCSRVFLKQVLANPDYPWTTDLVYLLSATPSPSLKKLLRSKFSDLSLRGALISSFAVNPEEEDRQYFIAGLQSSSVETLQQCIEALHFLKASDDPAENVELARMLRRLGHDGEERQVRDQTVELLRQNLKMKDSYQLGRDGDPQTAAITNWLTIVEQRFPQQFAASTQANVESLEKLKSRLSLINWTRGDAIQGQKLFQSRSCAQCHGQGRALGPDLTGVAGRFSRDDLFTAIVFPSLDVSPRYTGMQIVTTEGQVRTGMIVYEGLDGLVLRDTQNQTYRIEADQIETRQPMRQSLMPAGLLNDLSDEDFAHLYAYLRTLGLQSAASHESGSVK